MADELKRYSRQLREVWLSLIAISVGLGVQQGQALWPLSLPVALHFLVCTQFMLRWSKGNDHLTLATFSPAATWHRRGSDDKLRARFWHLIFYYSVTIAIFIAMLETVSSGHWFRSMVILLLLWDLYIPVFDKRARFSWVTGRHFLERLWRGQWSQMWLWDVAYSPQLWALNNLFAAALVCLVQVLAASTAVEDALLSGLTTAICLYNAYIDYQGTHLEVDDAC